MTTFSKKCEILSDFYMSSDEEGDVEFIRMNDLGIPLAVLICNGSAIATEYGQRWIELSYEALLEYLGVDIHGDFNSFEEITSLDSNA